MATAFSANPKEVAKPAKQGRSPNPKMRKRYCEDKFFEWYPNTHHSFGSYASIIGHPLGGNPGQIQR